MGNTEDDKHETPLLEALYEAELPLRCYVRLNS